MMLGVRTLANAPASFFFFYFGLGPQPRPSRMGDTVTAKEA
jgi:hypothetical protein